MTTSDWVTLTKSIFTGLLLGSLLPAAMALTAITASIIIAVVLFALLVVPRDNRLYALVGVIIGALLATFVPGLSFGSDVLIALALVFAVTWI